VNTTIKKGAAPPRQWLNHSCRGGAAINWWALPLVNAVFANEIRKLGQKLPKPGILFDQRVSFVGAFVATKGGLVPAKGILKQ